MSDKSENMLKNVNKMFEKSIKMWEILEKYFKGNRISLWILMNLFLNFPI